MQRTMEITEERLAELVDAERRLMSDSATIIIVKDENGRKIFDLNNVPEDCLPITRELTKENNKLKKENKRLEKALSSKRKVESKKTVEEKGVKALPKERIQPKAAVKKSQPKAAVKKSQPKAVAKKSQPKAVVKKSQPEVVVKKKRFRLFR